MIHKEVYTLLFLYKGVFNIFKLIEVLNTFTQNS